MQLKGDTRAAQEKKTPEGDSMEVISLTEHENTAKTDRQHWITRQAIQLAAIVVAQLPEDREESILIFDKTQLLIRDMLTGT